MPTKVRLVNLTAHPVTVKGRGGFVTLPRHKTAGLQATDSHLDTLSLEGCEVEVIRREYGRSMGLPKPRKDTLYIVSEKTALAFPERDDLICPARIRKGRNGPHVYCEAFARVVYSKHTADPEQRDIEQFFLEAERRSRA
jgi:hypothetical protein